MSADNDSEESVESEHLDWSKLPRELHYLIPAAKKYGWAWADSHIEQVLESIDDSAMEQLAGLAERIRINGDDERIEQWFKIFEPYDDEHPESLRVNCLLGILDELDLQWYAPLDTSADGLRKRWATSDWKQLILLAEQSLQRLGKDEVFALAVEALKRVPQNRLRRAMLCLSEVRSERALDWIEENIRGPVFDDWGRLAAVSGITWQRIKKWIDSGRPLSLVALDALEFCWNYDSVHLEKLQPKLQDAPEASEMTEVLNQYALRDPVPRVKRTVKGILANWDTICGTAK